MYINAPLGPVKSNILSKTENRGLILTSGNCKILVLCFKTRSNGKEFVRVDYLNDLDNLRNPIKKSNLANHQ